MTKKKRPEVAAAECREALLRVQRALENHRSGRPEDLSVPVLEAVAAELRAMLQALDKSAYRPGYGRFISDWPDENGLVEYLLGVAHDYDRWT